MAGSRLAMLMPARSRACSLAQQPTATIVTPGATAEVTLPEAIALANRVQPAVVSAQAGIRNAEAQKKVALGNWLPNLNASSGGGYFLFRGRAGR